MTLRLATTRKMLDKALDYHKRGDLKAAIPLLQQCVERDPENAEVLYWAGIGLLGMRDYPGGVAFLEHSRERDPSNPNLWYNLGVAYDASGRWEAARKAYEQALIFTPDAILPKNNLGGVLYRLGLPEQGYAMHSKALEPEKAEPGEMAGRALIRLLRGDWKRGWSEYEQRWKVSTHKAHNRRPIRGRPWKGQLLHGERILLHAEQGVGDTIQFGRYIGTVAMDFDGVPVVQVQAELKRLFVAQFPNFEVISHQERPKAHCPYYVSLMSLAGFMYGGDPIDTYADSPVYISSRLRGPPIRSLPGLKVGLCLKGNPHHMNDFDRSMPVAHAQPLLKVPGVSWVSLHGQIIPGLPMTQVEYEDFADTAAVVQQLDVVVTVDTSVAHLSAAMGKPTWLMPPCSPEFRWGLGERSPWYPDVKLYRRSHVRAWDDVVERVCQDLEAEAQ
jgi:hypothetical protein